MVDAQNNSKYRDWAPLICSLYACHACNIYTLLHVNPLLIVLDYFNRHSRWTKDIKTSTISKYVYLLSALNSELSFIVLEPENDPTDYEYLQSYNISTDRKSTVPKHISHKVWLCMRVPSRFGGMRDLTSVSSVSVLLTSVSSASPHFRSFLVFSSPWTFLQALSVLLWSVWPRRIAVTVIYRTNLETKCETL